MDYRERLYDAEEDLRVSMEGRIQRVWTSLPGIVTKVNLAQQTVEVQPAIQATQSFPNGTSKHVTMPLVPDVPIMFPSGGGYTLTFPVKVGDHCLLHFASRNIDGWWDSGKVSPPMDRRMHDLSDAFATIGPRHRQGVPANISSSTTTLRSDDGTLVIEMDHTNGAINMTTPTTVNIVSPAVTISASDHVTIDTPMLHVTGGIGGGADIAVAGDVINGDSTHLRTHRHPETGGVTNAPIPGS